MKFVTTAFRAEALRASQRSWARALFLALCIVALFQSYARLAANSPPSSTLESALGAPDFWPGVITTTAALRLKRADGSILDLPAGTPCDVERPTARGIEVSIDGTRYLLPVETTDFLEQIASRIAKDKASPPPQPAAAQAAAGTGTPTPDRWAAGQSAFHAMLTPALMHLRTGRLIPAGDAALRPDVDVLLFVGVSGSPSSRKVLQRLVEFDSRSGEARNLFALVYASHDRSHQAVADFMAEAGMTWVIVDPLSPQNEAALALGGRDVPCLILLDSHGDVLAHSTAPNGHYDLDSVINLLLKRLEERKKLTDKA